MLALTRLLIASPACQGNCGTLRVQIQLGGMKESHPGRGRLDALLILGLTRDLLYLVRADVQTGICAFPMDTCSQ